MIVGIAPGLFAQTVPATPPQEIRDPNAAMRTGFLVVSGIGVGGERFQHRGQRKAMAIRAAQVVAYRELLEVVEGIQVDAETKVVNAMADETVRARMEGKIRGAQTIYKHYDVDEDTATVYVRFPIKGQGSVTEALLPQLRDIPPPPDSRPYAPPTTPQQVSTTPPPATTAPPATTTPPPVQYADGLIVDVRAHSFRPALVNRILTEKGEVLYDPSKIAQEILVQRGSGDYTTDVGKAKAILAERGSQRPLTVEAAKVERFTNVHVNSAQATEIFSANQQNSFLEGAKVVFVLQ
jgi:hypothetical protein